MFGLTVLMRYFLGAGILTCSECRVVGLDRLSRLKGLTDSVPAETVSAKLGGRQ